MKRLINIPIVYLSDVIDDMIVDNEGGYTISKSLINELTEIEDDPEKMEVADHIFTAIFGWSLDTFCKKVNEHFIRLRLDSLGFKEEQINYLLDNHLEETLGILTSDLSEEEIATLCKLNTKSKMKEMIDSRMNDLWSELYTILEEATGKEYSGDISPDNSLLLDEIQDNILELFLSVSKDNVKSSISKEKLLDVVRFGYSKGYFIIEENDSFGCEGLHCVANPGHEIGSNGFYCFPASLSDGEMKRIAYTDKERLCGYIADAILGLIKMDNLDEVRGYFIDLRAILSTEDAFPLLHKYGIKKEELLKDLEEMIEEVSK